MALGYGGTTGRLFNFWGSGGKYIIKNDRRGNSRAGTMSDTGDAYGHRFSQTGTGAAQAKRDADTRTAAQKDADQVAAGKSNMAKNAEKQYNAYIANAKAGGTWSVAEFGKKMQKWQKMGYKGPTA